jgi:alkanesulfonate monooxygenase SsuD/methylene tetrahydromethanopterin reductase-like flavin-dependent oxidoreductase (luciferase family)
MRFGLTTDFRNPPGSGKTSAKVYAETIELFVGAETLGFDAAYVFEHHFTDDDYISSPMVAATAIAARTKRMRIGPDIAILPLYDPVRVAEDGAVLDLISNGRLDFGVGLGYRPEEYAGYGLDISRKGARAPTRLCRSFARSGRARPSPSTASISTSRAPGSRPARFSSRTRLSGSAASVAARRALPPVMAMVTSDPRIRRFTKCTLRSCAPSARTRRRRA